VLWGAVESAAESEPRATTQQSLAEYEPYLEPVRGAIFDEARQRGRSLTVEDAIKHALRERRLPTDAGRDVGIGT
jgi:hypothetical protein